MWQGLVLLTGGLTAGRAGRVPIGVPVANAGPDVAVDERTQVTVAGASAYDVDGQALTYAWARVSGPAVTLSNANTLAPSFTAPEVTANSTLVLSGATTAGQLDALTGTARPDAALADVAELYQLLFPTLSLTQGVRS